MMPFTHRILALIAAIGLVVTFWQGPAVSTWLAYHSSSLKSLSSQQFFGSNSINDAVIQRRVVAVADLHGDLEHAHNVLRMAHLIDNDEVPNWIGGHDVLVSTGDIVDRGDDTIALYQMFQRLRQQARSQGGDVLNCIGNHEMMNALMDWRYVTPGDLKSFGGAKARRHIMSTDGWIGQDWSANFSISHTIELLSPSHLPQALSKAYSVPRASFVHGGIHPKWAALGLTHINQVGHSLLLKALSNPRPQGWLPDRTTKEETEFYGEHGPLWYRGYALDEESSVCNEADKARLDLGVRHLVMGHTPHLSGFVIRCSGSVLLIDTGISRAYGGEQSALIFDTLIQPIQGKGIWEEKSTITALYKGRLPKIIDTRVRHVDV